MNKIKSDADARLAGFTHEVYAECDIADGVYLIKPDADLDDNIRAWDTDTQRFVRLNGWLWTFETVEAEEREPRTAAGSLD